MRKRVRRQYRARRPPASGRKPSLRLTPSDIEAIRDELIAYHKLFDLVFQRREQRYWSLFYLCGQLSNVERKTVEPMVLTFYGPDVNLVRAGQQFIGHSPWDSELLVLRHQQLVAESLGDPEGIVVIDGSGFPKQGQASVGVARQYCGCLGKIANCQEGVFEVYVTPQGYTFLDRRLYLHGEWFEDDHRDRWKKCGIPDDIPFRTEPELALDMVQALTHRGVVPFRWVAFDEHFGESPSLLDKIDALGKWYFAEVPCNTRVWLRRPQVEPPGRGPLGRPRTQPRVAPRAPRPRELREMAASLPQSAWQRYTIKEGSKGPIVAEFAFLRVTAVRNGLPGPRVWAVFRRGLRRQPEVKFYLSNAPADCVCSDLVRLSGLRWPVETTLEEAKGEVGMDHYETRTWLGWYHHMTQVFLAHHFLMRLRLKFKKSAGVDYGASTPIGRSCFGRGGKPAIRHSQPSHLPSTAQPRGLSFSSQKDVAPSQTTFQEAETLKSRSNAKSRCNTKSPP